MVRTKLNMQLIPKPTRPSLDLTVSFGRSTKLKECIEICPFDVRRDIILMLPEIVGDVELNELVFFLH